MIRRIPGIARGKIGKPRLGDLVVDRGQADGVRTWPFLPVKVSVGLILARQRLVQITFERFQVELCHTGALSDETAVDFGELDDLARHLEGPVNRFAGGDLPEELADQPARFNLDRHQFHRLRGRLGGCRCRDQTEKSHVEPRRSSAD